MKGKKRNQSPAPSLLGPIAIHWFVNGWVLPDAIDAGLISKDSSYMPGSHNRLIAGAGVRLMRDATGELPVDVPHQDYVLALGDDGHKAKIGELPYKVMVAIRTETELNVWIVGSHKSMKAAVANAIDSIADAFLIELGGTAQAMEFANFAIEHYPGLLDADAAFQAFCTAVGITE
jgi:hypothetical protein